MLFHSLRAWEQGKIIQKYSLTKDEFNRVITDVIVEFKDRRDNKLKEYEEIEDYNRLICFFINEFQFDSIYR